MKFGVVKSSDLVRSGNWSAGFVLSDSFTFLKEKSDEDIIVLAEEAIANTPDYVKDRAIKLLFSYEKNFDGEIEGYRHSISQSTMKKVASSIKTGKIHGLDNQESFVIAVCAYGMTELFKDNESLINDAVNDKIALLDKLQEINDFLKSN